MDIQIRAEEPSDFDQIRTVNQAAFGRDDEADLVEALRQDHDCVLSLVAEVDSRILGHLLFSRLPIHTESGTIAAISLAPMAVDPAFQNRGIGSKLMVHGLELLRESNEHIVIVLGHPEFYDRFGFTSELAQPLRSPFTGESWMALELAQEALQGVTGKVQYPAAFGIVSE